MLTFVITGLILTSPELVALDHTTVESRKYAASRLSGLSEAKLDAIVARVDVNGDGIVSDAEFAKQSSVFRDIVEKQGQQVSSIQSIKPANELSTWLGLRSKLVDDTSPRLRVLSYNIHHGAGVDGKLDLDRIAKVILSAKPDIVALQEVDRNAARTGKVDQAAELARLTKMKVLFGPNIKLGEGDYGNAILSRFPLKLRKNHKLPNIDNGEQRGVLDATVETPHGKVRILATHFDHRRPNEERIASAKFVNELLVKRATSNGKDSPSILPTILAGDLNATPKTEPLLVLSDKWRILPGMQRGDWPTVPVKKPTRQIDYVLAAPQELIEVREMRVLDEATASDHRPVLAIVELTATKNPE